MKTNSYSLPIPNALLMSTDQDQTQNIHPDNENFSCSNTDIENKMEVDECSDCIYEFSDNEIRNEILEIVVNR